MSTQNADLEESAPFDELRRRLYRPDASEADRARYRSAVDARDRRAADALIKAQEAAVPGQPFDPAVDSPSVAPSAPSPFPPPAPSPLPPQTGRRRPTVGVVVLLVAAVLVVVGAGAVLGRSAATGDADPEATSSPTPFTTVPVDTDDRAEFLQNLADGKVAGFSAYLVTHPSPAALRGATSYLTTEWKGTGPRTIATPAALGTRGRVTVFLVLATGARAEWTALLTTRAVDGRMRIGTLAERGGDLIAGIPSMTTFAATRQGGPDRLRIDVPAGVRWGAAMLVTD